MLRMMYFASTRYNLDSGACEGAKLDTYTLDGSPGGLQYISQMGHKLSLSILPAFWK